MKTRPILISLFVLVCLVQTANAQISWQKGTPPDYAYDDVFDSTASLPHGLVVDKFNRVWVGSFGSAAPGIIVRNPDGSEAAFSPIANGTFGAEAIPLDDGGCRGMALALDGNIIYAKGASLIILNVETGEIITKWDGTGSLTKPAVDASGNIYVGTVIGVSPITVLEPAFLSMIQQIELNPVAALARGLEVTADGKNLWTGNLSSGGPVYQYTTQDLITYSVSDSLFTDADGDAIFQFSITTMNWGPDSTLWCSHETENQELQSQNGLVIFDFKSQSYSTLLIPDIPGNAFNGPRGVGFSVTSDTLYVVSFNGGRVVRFIKGGATSVHAQFDETLPADFVLHQNYPNPFNPDTQIAFKLPFTGTVSLKVYNSRGQVVRTLLGSQTMPAGPHVLQWDGRDDRGNHVASGVYVYKLIFGNVSKSKTMMLVR